ncbi:hypothetical protein K8I61_10035 [bacterium]|nr:hypothetical protein [bacterium]
MPGSLRFAFPLLAVLLFAGCERDPVWLVEQTLNAREQALKDKDVESYAALFHPEYQYKTESVETVQSNIAKRFSANDRILLRTHNRHITFQNDGDIADVVQEYEIVQERGGQQIRSSGTERFFLKREKGLFGGKYLFFAGMGV